jgi:hypothetical protein
MPWHPPNALFNYLQISHCYLVINSICFKGHLPVFQRSKFSVLPAPFERFFVLLISHLERGDNYTQFFKTLQVDFALFSCFFKNIFFL